MKVFYFTVILNIWDIFGIKYRLGSRIETEMSRWKTLKGSDFIPAQGRIFWKLEPLRRAAPQPGGAQSEAGGPFVQYVGEGMVTCSR